MFKLWSIIDAAAAAVVLLYFTLSEVNYSSQRFGPLK